MTPLSSRQHTIYQPYLLLSYFFPWLCAWDVCYIIWAYRSCSSVCTLRHFIIIIAQTYLKALRLWDACLIHFVECVSNISHIVSVIHYTIYGAVCFQFAHFPHDDWENIYFVLSSALTQKYELLSIVNGWVMKPWYALYVSLYSYTSMGHSTYALLKSPLTHRGQDNMVAFCRRLVHCVKCHWNLFLMILLEITQF